jgi:hypothetical protein
MANSVTQFGLLDPLANSRPQLDQLPPGLRKAAEQMWWRSKAAKGPLSKRGKVVIIGPSPRELPLFLLPSPAEEKQRAIQETKGAFARFWKRTFQK